MILAIILVALGIFIEVKFHPRISFKGGVTFYYNVAKGARNQYKLF